MEVKMTLSFDIVSEKSRVLDWKRLPVIDEETNLPVFEYKQRLVAYHELKERPLLKVNGNQVIDGNAEDVNSFGNPVFTGHLAALLNNCRLKPTIEMTFSVASRVYTRKKGVKIYSIKVEWKKGEKEYFGYVGGFTVRPNKYGVYVNPPQWLIGDKYIPIISGSLKNLFLSMIEYEYRKGLETSLPSGDHQGSCTTCSFFNSAGFDREEDGQDVIYSCLLNQFQPFSLSELKEEDYERLGYSHQGRSLKMSGPQATYAWVEQKDHMFSLSDWRKIGSKMGGKWEDRLNSLFEPLYDDVKVIELLHESGRLDSAEDLDATIDDYRRQTVLYHQKKFVERHPEFRYLVRQEAVLKEDYKPEVSKAIDEMVPEEVGEKAHRVYTKDFLNKNVFTPCCLGVRYFASKTGELKTYRYVNDAPPVDVPVDLIDNLKA